MTLALFLKVLALVMLFLAALKISEPKWWAWGWGGLFLWFAIAIITV